MAGYMDYCYMHMHSDTLFESDFMPLHHPEQSRTYVAQLGLYIIIELYQFARHIRIISSTEPAYLSTYVMHIGNYRV